MKKIGVVKRKSDSKNRLPTKWGLPIFFCLGRLWKGSAVVWRGSTSYLRKLVLTRDRGTWFFSSRLKTDFKIEVTRL